jgi:hypothetical protein
MVALDVGGVLMAIDPDACPRMRRVNRSSAVVEGVPLRLTSPSCAWHSREQRSADPQSVGNRRRRFSQPASR